MKVGILFDLDGTLLSTLEDLTDSINHTLRAYHCPERTLAEVKGFIGNGARNLIARSLPGKESDPPFEEVFADYKAYYATHNQIKTHPYEGILEALEEIRREFPVAVVSNKHDTATKPMCKAYFGEEIFALGERPGCPKKPAPDMLRQAMAAIGVDTCIYVGDSEVDILTAKNAKMYSVGCSWGYRPREVLSETGADVIIDEPTQILDIFK